MNLRPDIHVHHQSCQNRGQKNKCSASKQATEATAAGGAGGQGGTYDRRRTDTDAPSQNKHERDTIPKRVRLLPRSLNSCWFTLERSWPAVCCRDISNTSTFCMMVRESYSQGIVAWLISRCSMLSRIYLARHGMAWHDKAKNDTEQGHRREKEVRTAAVFIVVTRGGFHEYHSVGPGAVCAWQQRCSVGRRPANEGHAALDAINERYTS